MGAIGAAGIGKIDLGVDAITILGHIIDLKQEHLTRIMSLRKITQALHLQLHPENFSESVDEKYEWNVLNSYMPNWIFFVGVCSLVLGGQMAIRQRHTCYIMIIKFRELDRIL